MSTKRLTTPALTPPAVERNTSRWGQERRLEFIDWRLQWDGRLNRSDLTTFFEISVPQASLDIAKYLALSPESAAYDRSAKVYLASDLFEPLYPSTSSARFLNELMMQSAGVLPSELSFLGWTPNIGTAPNPGRTAPSHVLVPLLKAIRNKARVVAQYQAVSSMEPTVRNLSPHALGFDGFRWHARAFCHTRGEYKDFVIARFLKAKLSGEAAVSGIQDSAWHRIVTLKIGANPRLSPSATRVIEMDYGMVDGSAKLECRQALLFYTLKRLGLLEGQEAPAYVQQIALLNRDELDQFLPKNAGDQAR